MVLFQSGQSTVTHVAKVINKLLSKRETEWTEMQKQLQKKRIQRKIESSKSQSTYTKKLLQLCKTWNGPCTTPNELEECIRKRPELIQKIVKTELSYYCKTHQSEKNMDPSLFKIMISHEEHLENLLVLLGDNNSVATGTSASVLDLPTNEELAQNVLTISKGSLDTLPPTTAPTISRINEMCVVVWLEDKPKWYIGYVIEELGDGRYRIEHLHRVSNSQDDFWGNPTNDDIQEVQEEQIIQCKVLGEWEMENTKLLRIRMRYHLKYSKEIDNVFKKLKI